MRIQSPERAVAEIEDTVKKYGARMVTFTNDSFTWNRKWMREFLAIYKERVGKPFAIQCRIKEFNAEDVEILGDAGCYSAMFGIESGSPRVRELILNRKMTNDEIIEGCRNMKKAGIKVITANMFGIPTETMEEAWQTLDLNIAIGTDVPSSTIFQAMPGTESFELLEKQNLLAKGHDVTNVQTQFGGTNIEQADIEKMVNLQRLFYFVVRYPFLRGLTTHLVNYNLTFIYKPIWALSFLMKYVNSRQLSFFETIKTGWYMRQIFLKVKR
jgi:anaerobic magnesium-protoporphyrin IX monomethyl ester cyclase